MTHHKIEKQKPLYNNGLLAIQVTQPFHCQHLKQRPAWFLGVDKKIEKISANGFYKTPWLLQLQLIAVGPVLISILIKLLLLWYLASSIVWSSSACSCDNARQPVGNWSNLRTNDSCWEKFRSVARSPQRQSSQILMGFWVSTKNDIMAKSMYLSRTRELWKHYY
jgi:hypothetical protein